MNATTTPGGTDLASLPRMEWDWIANDEVDPNSLTNELRDQSWAAVSDRGLEVFRHADVSRLLRDRNMEKQGHRIMGRLDAMGILEGPVREYHERSIITLDGDPHTRLRMPLSSFFAPRRVARLRDEIAVIVERALSGVSGQTTVDVHEVIGERIPAEVFCHLIDAPMELAPTFARISDSMLGPLIGHGGDRAQEHIDAYYECMQVVDDLIEQGRKKQVDNVLGDLIEMNDAGKITHQELHDQVGMLLEASIDNTAHQLTWAIATMLETPARWESIRDGDDDPAGVAEEILRLASITGNIPRFPAQSFEYNGITLEAGKPVYLHIRSANRDPEVFEDPEAFKPSRQSERGAITFGQGAHTCMGQHLARIEVQELARLFPRMYPDASLVQSRLSFGVATRVKSCTISLRSE